MKIIYKCSYVRMSWTGAAAIAILASAEDERDLFDVRIVVLLCLVLCTGVTMGSICTGRTAMASASREANWV
jgi:hypothetical protein